MEITGLSSSGGYPPSAQPTSAAGQLGEEQFLQLLVAQLQHQDPLKPMDNTQFISQLAEFSALEQLQKIADDQQTGLGLMLMSQAAMLVGREVVALDENGQQISGTVSEVRFDNLAPRLVIDGQEVDYFNVLRVA
jgi:flagellar basal-body rod modification protein FlgD